MKTLKIVVPIIATVVLTALAVLSAIWLTGLVPTGEWASLIRAGIVIFIIGSTLLIIAWSAYFSYTIRETIERLLGETKTRV